MHSLSMTLGICAYCLKSLTGSPLVTRFGVVCGQKKCRFAAAEDERVYLDILANGI